MRDVVPSAEPPTLYQLLATTVVVPSIFLAAPSKMYHWNLFPALFRPSSLSSVFPPLPLIEPPMRPSAVSALGRTRHTTETFPRSCRAVGFVTNSPLAPVPVNWSVVPNGPRPHTGFGL